MFTSLPPGTVNNSNPATGFIDFRGIDVPAGGQVRVEFDVRLLSTLVNGHMVVNQAQLLSSTGEFLSDSDDPNVNGQADPDPAVDDEDPTRVRIDAPPSPPTKALLSPTSGEATMGEELVYRIVVPGQPRNAPMHDVQVTDVLNANLEYVSATVTVGGVINGPGVVNSSTPSQLDITIDQVPTGQQAFVDVWPTLKIGSRTSWPPQRLPMPMKPASIWAAKGIGCIACPMIHGRFIIPMEKGGWKP